MPYYLGIDTSNYTTSVAIFNRDENLIYQQKKLLPVKNGTLGLKQSDAVFSHVRQLSEVIEKLFKELPRDIKSQIKAIAVSETPRNTEGSYMPCFLVGKMLAYSLSEVLKVPVYGVSHQEGHIISALYSTGMLKLAREKFIAFHFSGGTTECLLVNGSENGMAIEIIAESADLKAGQAIDRVGTMLQLSFPAGMELEKLALKSTKAYRLKPSFKGLNPSISGLQNKCEAMHKDGEEEANIARYAIEYISAVVAKMTENIINTYGDLPIVYSGGVMSNSIIRKNITEKFGGYFAEPVYSSDNAVGVAILAAIKEGYYE